MADRYCIPPPRALELVTHFGGSSAPHVAGPSLSPPPRIPPSPLSPAPHSPGRAGYGADSARGGVKLQSGQVPAGRQAGRPGPPSQPWGRPGPSSQGCSGGSPNDQTWGAGCGRAPGSPNPARVSRGNKCGLGGCIYLPTPRRSLGSPQTSLGRGATAFLGVRRGGRKPSRTSGPLKPPYPPLLRLEEPFGR